MPQGLIILVLLAAISLTGCASRRDSASVESAAKSDEAEVTSGGNEVAPAEGVVTVHLEEVDGYFIEGFEIGLRFETTDGKVS